MSVHVMDRIVVVLVMFLTLMLGVLSSSRQLISPSQLEMFVDEIQDMPRIQGFHVANGVFKSKSLKIGMFKKHWEDKVETDSILDMFKDNLKMIWDHFLCSDPFLA